MATPHILDIVGRALSDYLGEDISRTEAEARMDELLSLELAGSGA